MVDLLLSKSWCKYLRIVWVCMFSISCFTSQPHVPFFWVSKYVKIVINTRLVKFSDSIKLAFSQFLTYRCVHWQWMFKTCMRKCLWADTFQFLKRSGSCYYWDFSNSLSTGLCCLVLKSMHLKEMHVSDICKCDWYFKNRFLWFVMRMYTEKIHMNRFGPLKKGEFH